MARLPKIEPLTEEECGKLTAEHVAVLQGHIDGQKYEAMADAQNVPLGTIRSRLNRARAHLTKLRTPAEQPQAAE